MKIVFEFDQNELPKPFRGNAGLENLLRFIHTNLHTNQIEKKYRSLADENRLRAEYDSQGLNSQRMLSHIQMHNDADIALGNVLIGSMKVES
jgi:hypothetical protein